MFKLEMLPEDKIRRILFEQNGEYSLFYPAVITKEEVKDKVYKISKDNIEAVIIGLKHYTNETLVIVKILAKLQLVKEVWDASTKMSN